MRWRGHACEVTPVSEGGGAPAGVGARAGSSERLSMAASTPALQYPQWIPARCQPLPLAFNPDAVTVDLRWLTVRYGIQGRFQIADLRSRYGDQKGNRNPPQPLPRP